MGYVQIERADGTIDLPPREVERDYPVDSGPAWEEDRDLEWEEGLRNLVISGGNPYVLLVITPEGVQVTAQGIPPENIAQGLHEVAEGYAAGLAEQQRDAGL